MYPRLIWLGCLASEFWGSASVSMVLGAEVHIQAFVCGSKSVWHGLELAFLASSQLNPVLWVHRQCSKEQRLMRGSPLVQMCTTGKNRAENHFRLLLTVIQKSKMNMRRRRWETRIPV